MNTIFSANLTIDEANMLTEKRGIFHKRGFAKMGRKTQWNRWD
jgi:hypothetical protein